MKLSVIIPNLHSTFIDQTLDALRSQTFDLSQVEVLVVGLDGTRQVREDSLVRMISTGEPASPAVARNMGIRAASGDILCFTDADCLPAPAWLSDMAQGFSDDAVTVIGGGMAFEADNYWTLCDNVSWFHEFLTTAPLGERNQLPSMNLAVRRCVVDQVGLFDEAYPKAAGEDADWTVRMRQHGHRLQFEPEIMVKHCPNRAHLASLWQHGLTYGRYSLKVNPDYADFLKTPAILRSAWAVFLLTPLLALWSTSRIYARNRWLWRYWYTIPGVFISKVAWCLGASVRLAQR